MAALAMERGDPEVSRFIDSYKLSQDAESRRAKYGGDTSLPLNSDGYEDKQRSLRDERHKDWLVQQEKRKDPVYYRVGTPEQGFPGLGEYNKLRQEHNLVRQKEYNDMLRKQRQMEQEKLMARRRSPPRPAQPQQPQMDYNRSGEQARAEEKRDYQDYMGNYQYSINVPQKPLMDYGENKKLLNEERRRDYNVFMEKKAKEERYWAMRGRPVTPAGGLDIGGYDRQVKETAHAKKKEYKEMLDQQQKEHMYLRARQEPEMAILDRNAQQSQYLANKPPPGPGHSRGRDEPSRQTPAFWNEGREAQGPRSFDSGVPRSNRSSANVAMAFKTESQTQPLPEHPQYGQHPYFGEGSSEQYVAGGERVTHEAGERRASPVNQQARSPDKPANPEWLNEPVNDERFYVFGTPLAETQRNNTEVRQQQQTVKPAEVVKNAYYSSDDYEKFQKEIQRKQGDEYRDFLSKQFEPRTNAEGLPLGQYRYEPKRLAMEAERNKDYNALLEKKAGTEVRNRDWNFDQNGSLELQGDGAVQSRQRELRAERQKEYNTFMSQIKTPPRQSWPDPDGRGAMLVMNGEYDNVRQMYDAERKKDYIDVMQRRREQKVTNPDRRHEFVDTANGPYGGVFLGLGAHDNRSDALNRERHQEYNESLNQKYAGKERPSGRPNWAKDSIPNNTDRGRSPMRNQPPADQYQQMLDEKRREEASRRRYEDPEYQGRLAQGRDRGEAGPPRYGY